MSKKLLMLAFHYPPCKSSSGYLRTSKFYKYLPRCGWEPHVLTAHPRAHGVSDVPAVSEPSENVTRSFALDTQRHLSIRGKYPGFLALPDRWISWLPGAVVSGIRLLRRPDVRVIWSTYPIATAHLIAYCLKRLTKKPWVADFRDPMIDDVHPVGKAKRRAFRHIEELVFTHADLIVCTTPGAVRLYQERYPQRSPADIVCIGNGYDEDDFSAIAEPASGQNTPAGEPLTLVHSGTLYPLERDPVPFFNALAQLRQSGEIDGTVLQIILRATGHDELYSGLLEELGIRDIVALAPAQDYKVALREMMSADGLLVFQAANCNAQIPAKVYEYLRAGKPIFAMTDRAGDTATLLAQAGMEFIAPLDDEDAIVEALQRFLQGLKAGQIGPPEAEIVESLSRENSAGALAQRLDACLAKKGVETS